MGLDMYLEKHIYLGLPADKLHLAGVIRLSSGQSLNPEKLLKVVEEAGYWRKANAIHAWFVKNVQDGMDDCRTCYVGREQLADLLALVNASLKNRGKAGELLPPQEGFFFGSTELDDGYFDDLKETKKILQAALKDEHGEYYYHSSW